MLKNDVLLKFDVYGERFVAIERTKYFWGLVRKFTKDYRRILVPKATCRDSI